MDRTQKAMRGTLVMLIALVLSLFTGCKQEITADRVPDLLQDKVRHLGSYQLDMSLVQAIGMEHQLQQWYKAPDSLRTDVLLDDQPRYRFLLLQDGSLHCESFADGLSSELPATSDSVLFLEPVLISLLREAQMASFVHDSEADTFITDLQWRGLDGRTHAGELVLAGKSLIPLTLRLFVGEEQLQLTIRFKEVVLNPRLDDKLFTR